jgi:hypothetical protein
MATETVKEQALTIEITDASDAITMVWKGRSTDRDPARFLLPLLRGTLERAGNGQKQVVIDFASLDYMNSSTFSPLVRVLDEASRGQHRLRLEYSQDKKWQTLSFSALKAFTTHDGRISLRGK